MKPGTRCMWRDLRAYLKPWFVPILNSESSVALALRSTDYLPLFFTVHVRVFCLFVYPLRCLDCSNVATYPVHTYLRTFIISGGRNIGRTRPRPEGFDRNPHWARADYILMKRKQRSSLAIILFKRTLQCTDIT